MWPTKLSIWHPTGNLNLFAGSIFSSCMLEVCLTAGFKNCLGKGQAWVGSGEVLHPPPFSWLPFPSRTKYQLGQNWDTRCKWPNMTSRRPEITEAKYSLRLLNFHQASGLALNLFLRISQAENLEIDSFWVFK